MSITTKHGITKNKVRRTLKDDNPNLGRVQKRIFKQSFKFGHKFANLFHDPFGFDFVHVTRHCSIKHF